jgi:hypothetical protein
MNVQTPGGVACDALLEYGQFPSPFFCNLTDEVTRPRFWRGRPGPRSGGAEGPAPSRLGKSKLGTARTVSADLSSEALGEGEALTKAEAIPP